MKEPRTILPGNFLCLIEMVIQHSADIDKMGRWEDGTMGRWEDGKMGRWKMEDGIEKVGGREW